MEKYISSSQVNYGKRIPPVKAIEIFSAEDWETFIEEWLDTKTEYTETERLAGAGDKGRDVVAYVGKKGDVNCLWDCYQCKHYDSVLMPSKVWQEFGKILYYTHRGDYTAPRKYYFIAPRGCGTTLSSLLSNSKLLKEELIANWDKNCKNNITDKEEVKLEGDFLKYVNDFNFKIFDKIPTKLIIEEHKRHSNHLVRFGGGLPEREKLISIPTGVQDYENRYVDELLLAYSTSSPTVFSHIEDLKHSNVHRKHFERARINFHHAEQLRNFYRDSLPIGTFEDFQNEIFDGIINTVEEEYENAFKKVKEVENKAVSLVISSNPLSDVSVVKDRGGICHQLVNEGRLSWTNDE
ncbi:ABC-three component system protein [Spirosoma sp.]|uniref:ABC-three component system protein n=1 Tax=Spirosoma sp. TaxID=1899569 RepID=UPI0026140941|nr:ABC-three component system protein [Spirosoma sp.]MCX6218307.1 hypothetical protein [Spirosoma sp.]